MEEFRCERFYCAWLNFDIGDDFKKLWGGGLVVVGCTLDYSSGPFLSYEIEIGD